MRLVAGAANSDRPRPRLALTLLAGAWLGLGMLGQWGAALLAKGLGSGVLPAAAVLQAGGFIAALSLMVLFVGCVAASPQSALRTMALSGAAYLLNVGFVCAAVATPMRSEWYDHSLLDRHPDLTAGLLMIASALPLIALLCGARRRGRAPNAP